MLARCLQPFGVDEEEVTMRIPTLAALCCAAALSWACNLENQPGVGEEPGVVEDRTEGVERDATERKAEALHSTNRAR